MENALIFWGTWKQVSIHKIPTLSQWGQSLRCHQDSIRLRLCWWHQGAPSTYCVLKKLSPSLDTIHRRLNCSNSFWRSKYKVNSFVSPRNTSRSLADISVLFLGHSTYSLVFVPKEWNTQGGGFSACPNHLWIFCFVLLSVPALRCQLWLPGRYIYRL